MTINASCPHCSNLFSFDDGLVGQVGSCPSCQGQISLAVPAPASPPQPPAVPVRKASDPMLTMRGNIVQLGGVSYQVAQINSVRVQPGRVRPIAFLMMLLFWWSALSSMGKPHDPTGSTAFGIFFSLMLASFATYRFLDGLLRCKLMLTVSSGEVAALETIGRKRLDSIAADLVGAISAR